MSLVTSPPTVDSVEETGVSIPLVTVNKLPAVPVTVDRRDAIGVPTTVIRLPPELLIVDTRLLPGSLALYVLVGTDSVTALPMDLTVLMAGLFVLADSRVDVDLAGLVVMVDKTVGALLLGLFVIVKMELDIEPVASFVTMADTVLGVLTTESFVPVVKPDDATAGLMVDVTTTVEVFPSSRVVVTVTVITDTAVATAGAAPATAIVVVVEAGGATPTPKGVHQLLYSLP